MLYFHYNNGRSMSNEADSFSEHFIGTIPTNGYTVYRMFNEEDSTMLHIRY